MSNLIKYLRTKRYYVKPVAKDTELFGWLSIELTGWQNFLDDRRRAGWRVAFYNLWWIIRH